MPALRVTSQGLFTWTSQTLNLYENAIYMNMCLFFILFVLTFTFFLEAVVSFLNIRALTPTLPKEFENIYDNDKYKKSQKYTKITTRFSLVQNGFSTLITILFLLLGGFNMVDLWARSFGFSEITTGLIFTGVLILFSFLSGLPFSVYSTFVIEEQFGFNKTTVQTFIVDIIKGSALIIIIGTPILTLTLWFFMSTGTYAWLFC